MQTLKIVVLVIVGLLLNICQTYAQTDNEFINKWIMHRTGTSTPILENVQIKGKYYGCQEKGKPTLRNTQSTQALGHNGVALFTTNGEIVAPDPGTINNFIKIISCNPVPAPQTTQQPKEKTSNEPLYKRRKAKDENPTAQTEQIVILDPVEKAIENAQKMHKYGRDSYKQSLEDAFSLLGAARDQEIDVLEHEIEKILLLNKLDSVRNTNPNPSKTPVNKSLESSNNFLSNNYLLIIGILLVAVAILFSFKNKKSQQVTNS